MIPPASIGEALVPILRLPSEQFNQFLVAVTGPKSFDLPKEDIADLVKKLPTLRATLPFALGALTFLYTNLVRAESEEPAPLDPSVVQEILEDISEKIGDAKAEAAERLSALLSKRDAHEHYRKLRRLQSGFLPNATGFSSFVDLRPDYAEEGDDLSISGYVPMIQFRISTDAPGDARRMVFQMTETALAQLKEAIERAESKLKAVRTQPNTMLKLIDV